MTGTSAEAVVGPGQGDVITDSDGRQATSGSRDSPDVERSSTAAQLKLLASSHAAYGVTHLASLARLLPERDPHEGIYELLDRTLDDFDDIGEAAAHLIKFELAMLAELGFGLDLETCAATGATTELIYVSPKSGGAVSRQAGATGCCGCRRSCARARAAPTAGPTRTCRMAFSSPDCFCCATCWSRAGRAIPTPAKALSMR